MMQGLLEANDNNSFKSVVTINIWPPLIKSVAMTVADCKYASLTLASTVKCRNDCSNYSQKCRNDCRDYSQKCRKDFKWLQSKVSQWL